MHVNLVKDFICLFEESGRHVMRRFFAAATVPELVAWILSFGAEAKVVQPDWLIVEVFQDDYIKKTDRYS